MDSVNINDVVWVQLTAAGVDQHKKWRASLDELLAKFPLDLSPDYKSTPKVGGLLRVQLHELMHIFGPVLVMGNDTPFELCRVYFQDPSAIRQKEETDGEH